MIGLFIPGGLPWRIVAAVAGLALLVAVVGGAYYAGRMDGKRQLEAEQMRARLEAERLRQGLDNAIRRLNDRDLCRRLGGMPDVCNSL